jgi:branched-chain amino acid transport system ATP-binding protein
VLQPAASLSSLLELRRLHLAFGGVRAIEDVSFAVTGGEVLGLIGPNGAGKTSVFNCITGYYRPSRGEVTLAGRSIGGKSPYQISRLGIRRTFQNVKLFGGLSVLANIAAGAYASKLTDGQLDGELAALCDELAIAPRTLLRMAEELPYGLQRRIELARALIANPIVLLVDEPGAGLSGGEKRSIVAVLRRVAVTRQIGVVLIEHDLGMIARACDRVVVLDHGMVVGSGTPDEVRRDPAVIAAYIGT